jgi:hypothetical protein
MTAPKRIQRKRVKGFDLQAVSMALNGLPARSVTRPGPYGNPFKVGDTYKHAHVPIHETVTLDNALALFETYARDRMDEDPGWLEPLRGKNLACFCKEGALCHGDILLRLANLPVAAREEM